MRFIPLGLACVIVLVAAPMASASGDDSGGAAASLTGENLVAAETPVDATPPGTATVSGTCNPLGNSEFSFTVTGNAFGPYPGTFTESGTFTIGPIGVPGAPNTLVSFDATFTITSPAGTVTGAKSLAADVPGTNVGLCGSFSGFVPPEPNAVNIQAPVRYTAHVPGGTDSGEGSVTLQDGQLRGLPGGGFSFSENFVSTSTVTVCDEDNQGDDASQGDEDQGNEALCDEPEDDLG